MTYTRNLRPPLRKNLVRHQETKSVLLQTYIPNNKFHGHLVTFSFYIYLIFSQLKMYSLLK